MIRKPNIKITYGRKTTEHYLHHERVLKKNIKKKEKEKKMQHRSFLQQEKNSGGMGVGMLFVTFQSKKNPNIMSLVRKRKHQQEHAGAQKLLLQVLSRWLNYMQIGISIKFLQTWKSLGLRIYLFRTFWFHTIGIISIVFLQFNSVSEVVKTISNNIIIMPNSHYLHFTSSSAHNADQFCSQCKK